MEIIQEFIAYTTLSCLFGILDNIIVIVAFMKTLKGIFASHKTRNIMACFLSTGK